jgi:hypothetical protein
MPRTRGDEEFFQRLQRCPEYIRKIFESIDAYLVGLDDVTTRIDAKQLGRTYYRGGRWFCRMDPKPVKAWIGVRVHGVEPAVIGTVSKVRERHNDPHWIFMSDPAKLADLKRVLRMAYDARKEAP